MPNYLLLQNGDNLLLQGGGLLELQSDVGGDPVQLTIVATPDGVVDRYDRALWLTMPFNIGWAVPEAPAAPRQRTLRGTWRAPAPISGTWRETPSITGTLRAPMITGTYDPGEEVS